MAVQVSQTVEYIEGCTKDPFKSPDSWYFLSASVIPCLNPHNLYPFLKPSASTIFTSIASIHQNCYTLS